MKFGANQLRFEDLHYSLSDGYVATRLLFRLICNCRASESRSKLYLVMPSAADNHAPFFAQAVLQAAYTNKTNVPADLQSAGIEYKDFSIRLLPIYDL